MIDSQTAVLTAAADGTASHTFRPVQGRLVAVLVEYAASSAATTHVTLSLAAAGSRGAVTLLTLADTNTTGFYPLGYKLYDESGAGVTYDGTNEVYVSPPISGEITVDVAQQTEAKTVTVTIFVES